jgi:hypothetical protein
MEHRKIVKDSLAALSTAPDIMGNGIAALALESRLNAAGYYIVLLEPTDRKNAKLDELKGQARDAE